MISLWTLYFIGSIATYIWMLYFWSKIIKLLSVKQNVIAFFVTALCSLFYPIFYLYVIFTSGISIKVVEE